MWFVCNYRFALPSELFFVVVCYLFRPTDESAVHIQEGIFPLTSEINRITSYIYIEPALLLSHISHNLFLFDSRCPTTRRRCSVLRNVRTVTSTRIDRGCPVTSPGYDGHRPSTRLLHSSTLVASYRKLQRTN